MAAIDDLADKVTALETVEDAAIQLLTNIAQALKDAGTDPAKLAALATRIDADKQKLSDAITANTPAA